MPNVPFMASAGGMQCEAQSAPFSSAKQAICNEAMRPPVPSEMGHLAFPHPFNQFDNLKSALIALQQRLHHTFTNTALLQQALTHRSFSADHYERLEFLGDSVLGVVVSDMLYRQLQTLPEGDLSRVRANLVKQDTLHALSVSLGLPAVLRLGDGELRSGGQKRPSILADVLEAVIGAVYLDAGFATAQAVVQRLYQSVTINPDMQAIGKDPKTALQEWLQAKRMNVPSYRVVATTGAAHQQIFEVECLITELKQCERGKGGSRRAAEQAAASALLHTLQTQMKP